MTDFKALLEALVDAKVEFVLVGGLAAIARGSAPSREVLEIVRIDVLFAYESTRDPSR